ncbi:hypothetical protein GGX14DRAFT_651120 [Mycena pura]|uniref:Uncharacterized protein n=1 Tax=Mycena pura TaxID=153505 RepID=A0AAD6YNI3_9AGAR|nr:hypothetical protein GGX14DRAFT_651120 [Mycena pura]
MLVANTSTRRTSLFSNFPLHLNLHAIVDDSDGNFSSDASLIGAAQARLSPNPIPGLRSITMLHQGPQPSLPLLSTPPQLPTLLMISSKLPRFLQSPAPSPSPSTAPPAPLLPQSLRRPRLPVGVDAAWCAYRAGIQPIYDLAGLSALPPPQGTSESAWAAVGALVFVGPDGMHHSPAQSDSTCRHARIPSLLPTFLRQFQLFARLRLLALHFVQLHLDLRFLQLDLPGRHEGNIPRRAVLVGPGGQRQWSGQRGVIFHEPCEVWLDGIDWRERAGLAAAPHGGERRGTSHMSTSDMGPVLSTSTLWTTSGPPPPSPPREHRKGKGEERAADDRGHAAARPSTPAAPDPVLAREHRASPATQLGGAEADVADHAQSCKA